MKSIVKLLSVLTVFASLVLLTHNSLAAAATYEIDATHSTLGFAVKHLQVGTTRGSFNDYTGSISYDPNDLSTFNADVTIKVDSINTKVEARDKHLKSPEFFDAEKFPTITFKSTRLEKRGEGMVIVGNLTMRDVTKEITFPVTISGPVKSPFGTMVIGIEGETILNRQDYGISFSKTIDNGGLMVDDMVTLNIEIEAGAKEVPAEPAAQ